MMRHNVVKTPPCDMCGKEKVIYPFASVPAMTGFQLNDGRILNICTPCMERLVTMSEEEQKKAFERMGVEV